MRNQRMKNEDGRRREDENLTEKKKMTGALT